MLGRALWIVVAMAASLMGQESIYFERDFPGAVPDRFEVTLGRDGTAMYAEGGEDRVELAVGEAAAGSVFELAAAVDYFARPVASRRKVASTGRKILRYEEGDSVRGEVEFDYSEIREVREIASWFVRLAETRQHLAELERVYRFDRLGVNQALVHLEQAYERDRIVAPELLEPILGKIAEQARIVHLARARAAGLLERIAASRH